MFKISLITVGKQKSGSEKDLVLRYLKQLRSYAKIDIIELAPTKFSSKSDAPKVWKAEAERIKHSLSEQATTILLTEHGEQLDSMDFATKLKRWGENGAKHIQFIVAGPLGIDPSLQNEVDETLSLSSMTFTHDLAQVLLLEQIYRAMTIINKKEYHY